jgi:hypothetical protein
MTQEKFVKVLDKGRYSYMIEGDRVIVTHPGYVNLKSLQTLPQGIEFNNKGDVNLHSLQTLSQGIVFNNVGYVYLDFLETLPQRIEFKNVSGVYLESLMGGWFSHWDGNIEGIHQVRLLNKMISLGLFERNL